MRIYPAIDILSSRAVRLYKGDYSRVTVYSDSPLAVAEEMERKGAKYLHVVDLDGARERKRTNSCVIVEIVRNTSLSVEIGGGIREMEDIDYYLSLGVDRVILGTKALDSDFLSSSLDKYGSERIVAGVDLRNGMVALNGWTEDTALDGIETLKKMETLGLRYAVVTDISRDGTLTGPSVDLYRRIIERTNLEITASGGIGSIDDVKAVRMCGCSSVIIGKAYYEGKIDLSDALREAE